MHDTAADIHREIVRPSESAGEGWTPPLNGVASLRRNVAWAAIGNAGYAACQWGVLIVLTKLTTAADVGRFALGLAVTAPVMIAAGLQLRMVQATDARGEYPFGVYLGLRLVTTALAFATIGIIAISAGYRGDTLLVITFVALAKAFEAVSDIIFGLFQQRENLRRIAISMLLKGIASVLSLGLTLWWTKSVVTAALMMALVWGGLLVVYDVAGGARLAPLRPAMTTAAAWRLGCLALPMGLVAGLQSLITNVPRYTIEASQGSAALGHFAAIAYLILAGNQLVMALWAAASPRLARCFMTDISAYRRLAARTTAAAGAMGVVVVIGATVLGEPVLKLAYSAEYAAHVRVLVWLSVWAAVGYVASGLSCAVSAARRFPEQLLVAMLALVVCSVASRLLIPKYGLVGAAWALVAAAVTQACCLATIYVGILWARASAVMASRTTAAEVAGT